jgi:hypothetical protein
VPLLGCRGVQGAPAEQEIEGIPDAELAAEETPAPAAEAEPTEG